MAGLASLLIDSTARLYRSTARANLLFVSTARFSLVIGSTNGVSLTFGSTARVRSGF